MISFDRACILIGGNGGADSEAGRDTDAARQRDEVGMKIGAIAGARVTCVDGIPTTPTSA